MASKKKLLQAAAGSAGGAGLDVDEVFSTYLYDGTGSAQTITNGIDLSGEGGLVWIKERTNVSNHGLFDTERGVTKYIHSDGTDAEQTGATTLTAFNSNGFSIGSGFVNDNNRDMCSWTFRKAPKFFDVVTWTGDGLTGRSISHNLGGTPGFIAIKALDSVSGSSGDGSWLCCARKSDGSYAVGDGTSSTSTYGFGFNKTTQSYGTTSSSNAATHITDSAFSIQYVTGDGSGTQYLGNTSGKNYVAYLFAHNDSGDGEFGPDSDQDIIKCGSYTGNGSASGPTVNLGFEPQWIMIKDTTAANYWMIFDVMRGLPSGVANSAATLKPNGTDAEFDAFGIDLSASGFQITDSNGIINDNGNTYIYMAIRRGPLAAPESATDVFAIDTLGGTSPTPPGFNSGFTVDMAFLKPKSSSSDWLLTSRLIQGKQLVTNSTVAEVNETGNLFDYQNGYYDYPYSDSNRQGWMWKRAPSYFDVCCYSGTGSAQTISHNLGAVPEMIWVKRRESTGAWAVYHKGLNGGTTPEDYVIELNDTAGEYNYTNWNDTAPTSSVFSLGTANSVNNSSGTYIAYLFATVAGVSKVGSVSHTNGTDTNVSCGFSSGARFILIKRTDGASSWYVFDTVRGIVAGNDKGLYLQSTLAEQTGDWIDPFSSGFTMVGASFDTGSYIFYAIA